MLVVFGLFTTALVIYCVSEGFVILMIPFVLSLALFFLLNKKVQTQKWFLEWAKDFFFTVLPFFLILILLAAFLFVTNIDLKLIETIYYDGETIVYLI